MASTRKKEAETSPLVGVVRSFDQVASTTLAENFAFAVVLSLNYL
jgi:hypothetical protein